MKKLFILTGVVNIALSVHALDNHQLLQKFVKQEEPLRCRLTRVVGDRNYFRRCGFESFMKQNPRDIWRREIAQAGRATEECKTLYENLSLSRLKEKSISEANIVKLESDTEKYKKSYENLRRRIFLTVGFAGCVAILVAGSQSADISAHVMNLMSPFKKVNS